MKTKNGESMKSKEGQMHIKNGRWTTQGNRTGNRRRENTGQDSERTQTTRQDRTGQDRPRQDNATNDTTGKNSSGKVTYDTARQYRTGQGTTE